MRSLSITVLMILAAFALGLALGGELPRSVSAQDEQEEEITWDHDGEKLVLFNQTDDEVFLVRGKTDEEAGAEPPGDSSGYMAMSATGVDEILVYKLKAELICDPRQCRRCNGEFCPAPQWPPFDEDVKALLGPQ